jgi:hypothetical protein
MFAGALHLRRNSFFWLHVPNNLRDIQNIWEVRYRFLGIHTNLKTVHEDLCMHWTLYMSVQYLCSTMRSSSAS